MKANNIFEQTLKIAEQFAKDAQNVPKMFDSMLAEVLPNATTEEKLNYNNLLKSQTRLLRTHGKRAIL